MVVVDNVFSALTALGAAGRARISGKVIAVTGSVGKTSTKEMLKSTLSEQFIVHASENSYNNQWGVPLTLARMPVQTEIAILEIGMNNPGEILPLAEMVKPDIAIITNVTNVIIIVILLEWIKVCNTIVIFIINSIIITIWNNSFINNKYSTYCS